MNITAILYTKIEAYENARLCLARVMEDADATTGISAELYQQVTAGAYTANSNALEDLTNTARLISGQPYLDVACMVDKLGVALLELDAGKITHGEYARTVLSFVEIITGRA